MNPNFIAALLCALRIVRADPFRFDSQGKWRWSQSAKDASSLVVQYHRADHLAPFHHLEGLQQVLEAAMAGYHLIEIKASLAVKFDIVGRVDYESSRAQNGSHDLALTHQQSIWDGQVGSAGDGADDDRRSA